MTLLTVSCLLVLFTAPAAESAGVPGDDIVNDEAALALTPAAPSEPLNVTADRGDGFVWLWWEHPSSQGSELIKRYAIYRGDTSGGQDPSPIDHVGVGVNFYEDTDVTNGDTYYYKITAISDYGEGPESDEVSATPSDTGDVPGAPTNVEVTNLVYSAGITFSKPAVEGSTTVRSYSLYKGETPETIDYIFRIAEGDWNTFEFEDYANPGNDYYYALKAENSYGKSENSTPVMVHVGGTGTVPSAPQNLIATPLDGMVMLGWDVPVNPSAGGILQYDVYRGTSSGEEDPTPIGSSLPYGDIPPFTYYIDIDVTNDEMYWYEVKAVGSGGSSPFSNEKFAVPSQVGIEPDPPYMMIAAPGNAQVFMMWFPTDWPEGYVVNVTGFDVYRSTTSGQPGTLIASLGKSVYNYWDNTSSNGVTYYYKVKAKYGMGESDFSNELSATPSATGDAPDAPTGLLGTPTNGGGMLKIEYDSIPEPFILGYNIYRGTTPDGEGATPIGSTSYYSLGDLFYLDDTGPDDDTYYYKVKAKGLYGDSGFSNEVKAFTSLHGDPPESATGLSAVASSGKIDLTWDNLYFGTANWVSCGILRDNGSGYMLIGVIKAFPGVQSSFTDTSVVVGVTYHYKIWSENSYGDAELSAEASATAVGGTSPPSAPQNLVAAGGDGQVTLTWDVPSSQGDSPIMRYDIFRGPSAGSIGTTPIGNVAAGTLTYTDTTVTNEETYYYQVKAVNAYGSSPASNTAQATPSAAGTAPGAPTNLQATGGYLNISLSWSAPSNPGSGVSNYLIFRGTSAGGEGTTPIDAVSGSTLTYTDTDVTAGVPYYYKVKANNTYGSSAFSNEANATATNTTTGTPSAPRNLAAAPGPGKVTLTWEGPASDGGSPITGYNIYRSLGGISTFQATVGASVLTYVDTNGTVGTEYTYIVEAVNANGIGDDSSPVEAASQETPSDGGIDPVIIAVVVVVVIVAVGAVAALWWMRR